MKTFLLGAVAALALAAPGVAAADSSGYVDLGYTNTDFGSGDADTWTLGGAAAWGGQGTLGVQLDGTIANQDFGGGGDVDLYNLGGHLFTRNSGYLVGGFVDFGNTDFGSGDFDYWTVGGEGQIYLTRTTLNGVLAYSDSDDLNANMTTLDLGATHFVTDNFSFGGGVGFGSLDAGGDTDFWSANIGAEYQFASMPVSVFGGYTYADWDFVDTDAITVGVRYNFGGSLFERDRSGASLTRGGGFGRLGGIL